MRSRPFKTTRFVLSRSALLTVLLMSACSISIGSGEKSSTEPTIGLATTVVETTPPTEVVMTDPPTTTTDAPRLPLATGDCFDWDGDFVSPVQCELLHDGQVISPSVRLDGDLQDPDLDALVLWTCGSYYEELLGSAYSEENSNWLIKPVVLDEDAAKIQCSVVKWDGARWAGTAENFVGGYAGIEVGDCFDFPTEMSDAVEVDCELAHDAEMYVVDKPIGINRKSAEYPTEDEWWDIASSICDRSFERYTGLSIDDPDVSYTFIYVLEEDWSDVTARVMSCAVTYVSGLKINGSLAG